MATATSRLSAAIGLLLSLAGCAQPAPPAPPPAAAAPPALAGTLVVVRPLRLGGAAAAGDVGRSVLSALGAPAAGTTGAVAEFIVREDGGRTISVVQPDPGDLRTGARVTVLPGSGPGSSKVVATRIVAAAR